VEHGTVAVLDRRNRPHEVTTFRKDVTTDGRHAQVAFGVSLDEDLARRDFTVNAIAYHPLKHEWRDRFGGEADLGARLIRAVGDPGQRFREDYLRVVRALRSAARFGFQIDPPTWEAARAAVEGLRRLSAERVRDEWFKGLRTARRPSVLVRLWGEVGALDMWLPEVVKGEGGREKGGAENLGAMRRDPVLMTAFLSPDPAATLTRLRCSNAEIERGARIGEHRGAWPEPTADAAVRRWLSRVGAAADDLLAIARAQRGADELVETVRRARASKVPLALSDLAVTGDDLLAAGVPRGPAVGETLRRLLDLVLEDPSLNTRVKLLGHVKAARPSSEGRRRGRE
jgi:tRNA nucleotidyltransferase (CCA-adding enzyme)